MSAIAGIWRFGASADVGDLCARMLAAQQIYGPHDGRHWSGDGIAMGRRLHRTVPQDIFDRQPLRSADGRLVLVADVRLDNRSELLSALGWPVGRLETDCDAAILLAALEQWGDSALDRLAGDFAFALWDAREQALTLARDFMGQRPLHYHRGRDFFAFSSMAKGLHALPDVPYAPDEQVMAEFVALMPQSGPGSFFKDIARVEAGQVLRITRDRTTARFYWNPARPSASRRNSADYVEGLRHHLDQATADRLRGANGAIASHLSSGFDSSAVTATAARLMAGQGGKVVAFTSAPRAGYDGREPPRRMGDEGPLAAATVALYPNIEHVLVRTGHLSPVEDLDKSFFLFERPMLNLCNWNWGRTINQEARARGLSVLLTGQMGNMSISYTGIELLPELLRRGLFLKLATQAMQLAAKGEKRWLSIFAVTLGPYLPARLWQFINQTLESKGQDILHYTAVRGDRLAALDLPRLAKERDLDISYRPWKDGFAMRRWVMSRADIGNYNKGTLAGWGIDQRDPTADRRLVEYCLAVPMEEYLSNGVPRALARRALADRLPQAVLQERRKGLQAIDWHEGMVAAREDITNQIQRLENCSPAAQLLDLDRLRKLAEEMPSTGWDRTNVIQAYRLAMLRGVSAGSFLRKASGGNQ